MRNKKPGDPMNESGKGKSEDESAGSPRATAVQQALRTTIQAGAR